MIVKANIELPGQAQEVTSTAAQPSGRPQQAFGESLLAASKTLSEAGDSNKGSVKTTRQQRSAPEDAKAPGTVSDGRAVLEPIIAQQPALPQHVLLTRQAPLHDPIANSMQFPLEESNVPPDDSTVVASDSIGGVTELRLPGTAAGMAQSGTVQSEDVQSIYPPWDSGAGQLASALSGFGVQGIEVPLTASLKTRSDASSTVGCATSKIARSTTEKEVSNAAPCGVQNLAPEEVLSAAAIAAPVAPANATQTSDQNVVPDAAPKPFQNATPDVPSGATATAATGAAAIILSNSVPNAFHNEIAKIPQHSISDAAASAAAIAPLSTGAASVPHVAPIASARGDQAQALGPVSTDKAIPPLVVPAGKTFVPGLSVPFATADELLAMTQPGDGLSRTGQAAGSGFNSSSVAKPSATAGISGMQGSKGPTNNAFGPMQHSQLGTEPGSQETTATSDQSRGVSSPQGQDAAPFQMNFTNDVGAATMHAQSPAVSSPVQTAPMLAGVAAHAAKMQDNSAPASPVVPQALPVINTAKLIQSMGQSEMRVGMRSTEFGNISISTSATRDVISAQISLDHGELARTLAAHLPEMQARLGSNQVVDVRIDLNGTCAGPGAGTSGGMSNGPSDQSRGGRQQAGNAASSYSGNSVSGWQASHTPAAMTAGDGRLSARLDIRV